MTALLVLGTVAIAAGFPLAGALLIALGLIVHTVRGAQ